MSTKCFYWACHGTNGDCSADGSLYEGVWRAYSISTEVKTTDLRPGCSIVYPVVNGESLYSPSSLGFGSQAAFITFREATAAEVSRLGCAVIQLPSGKMSDDRASTSYDCINGACTSSSTYKTPGFYKFLSECETACGIGCSGQCISKADWAKIEGLAAQLKNKNCS